MGAATPTQLIDNERVRVTEWRFRPGEATGWHRHEYDYVVVPVTTGQLHLKEPDGERTIDIVLGTPYFREEGVEHDVINPSETDDVIFIEVEMK
jgi:quercetin dioxygenase-like cupin family protein